MTRCGQQTAALRDFDPAHVRFGQSRPMRSMWNVHALALRPSKWTCASCLDTSANAGADLSGFVPSVPAAMIQVRGLMRSHKLDHA
jgi:hypothetical protein